MLKILGYFLLFLVLHNGRSCDGIYVASFPQTQAAPLAVVSGSSSSTRPQQKQYPKEEVDAVNSLIRLWRLEKTVSFSSVGCVTPKCTRVITGDCEIDNSFCRVTEIDLCSKKLVGTIPKSLMNLSRLSELYLCDNMLGGPVPRFLAEMKSLKTLDLEGNYFNESIPIAFGILPSLETLYMGFNLLSGSIPSELGNISSLKELYVENNQLCGQLPEQLGNLSNLQELSIEGNYFNGSIPDFIANWRYLQLLILEGNNFDGPLPNAIGELTRVQYLFITDLAGDGRFSMFPELKKGVALKFLVLRNCSLTGPIPDFIWKLQDLLHLDLSFNSLTGGIPIDVNLQYLDRIFLRKNKLNGTLPRWLTNLTRSKVDVSENFFTNVTIPTDNISANLNLFACCNTTHQHLKWQEANYHCENDSYTNDHLYINCGGIGVTINGSNYEADMQKEGGSTFYLSPGKTWAYSSMGASFVNDPDTYIVNKTCNISLEDGLLYQNARVSPLSLKYYGFCLKNGDYTLKLHFAEIMLDDRSFPRERVFDVDIQGGQHYLPDFNIKEEAGGLNKNITRVFNITVQNRRLEIHLYSSSKSSTSFLGKYNGPLISAISLSRVVKHQKLSSAIIGVIAGSATLFSVLMLFVFWKLGWLGGKSSKDEELKAIELFPGGVLTFRQIKAATKNFDPENKIGEGGFGVVYKGVLANGTQVAVKQLSAKSKQGAREFINEIGTTYALQHQNLVRLIGCCAEQHQLLLVYEYMENNSLEHALFGPEDVKSRLTWLTRVKICCDIARGLAFLHGESRLKIMHRDIKPTNILLDKDFNAKISDFGYAKLNEDEDNQLTTKIAGTTGYMAPEYMLGYVTPKADVYSFGIVMLEIFSGKNISIFRPRDQTVYLLDTAYEYQRQGNLIALLDAKLGSDYTYNEALKILNLAMECVNAAPKLRPGMSEVVKVLEGVLKVESKRKSKNKSTGNTSVVNSVIASPETSFSQSTQSWSTSQEGASNTTISISTDKEIMSTSAD